MKKFLVSLIFLLMLFCGISSADIVYSTSNGKIGFIKISSNSSGDVITFDGVKYSGSVTNPFLSSYRDKDDNNYVMLIDRLDSGDTVQRFPFNDLSSPVDSEPIFLTDVKGTTATAFSNNGRSLYFATPSGLIDIDTDTMTMKRQFDCTPKTSDDVAREVKGVAINGNRVLALIDNQDDEYNDAVFMFDGQLNTGVEAFSSFEGINNDMTSMTWINRRLAFTRSKGIDVLSGSTFTTVVSTDAPVKSLQSDTGYGILYATQSQSDDVYVDTLLHYTDDTSDFSTVTVNTSSSNLQLLRHDKVLAAILGDEIRFYNAEDGTLLNTFTSSQLGGSPVSMTIAYTGGTSKSDSSSSGCEVGSVRTIALIFLGMTFKLKRKK